MELYKRVDQIIEQLRPAFSRVVTFEWFVLLLWGVLLSTQEAAVTSYLNAIGLGEKFYHQALHWFHSHGFKLDELCQHWGYWLQCHPNCHRLQGRWVYVGDGIKVSKEGRKMPGVKRLHQESADVSKPEWIRGHYFSVLGVLLKAEKALFATPVALKLHDGIEAVESKLEATLVDKMANLCLDFMAVGSYALLDAYYASVKVLQPFREKGLHLITRVRSTTVAHAAFCPRPGKHGPGRPRKWGSDVKLQELFAPPEECHQASVWLYGQTMTVYYQCFELYWDSAEDLVLFVLAQLPTGKRIMLLSSDLTLTGAQVIEAYGWRFKIEVSFRSLVQLLNGFAYRFWLKSMDKATRWPKNLCMADYDKDFQTQVNNKVEAFERFVNLNAMALGLLQVLAIELPHGVWTHFPRWFRTLPQHGFPSEQIVRIALQQQQPQILSRSRPTLLLTKLLAAKTSSAQNLEYKALVN